MLPAARTRVSVGKTSPTISGARTVAAVRTLPGVSMNQHIWPYDMALVRLSKPVTGPTIRVGAAVAPVGTPATALGFGCTTAGLADPCSQSPRLRRLTTIKIGTDCGNKAVIQSGLSALRERDTCTESGGTGQIRTRDSGGPLLRYVNGVPEVVGVASWVAIDTEAYRGFYFKPTFGDPWLERAISGADFDASNKANCADTTAFSAAYAAGSPRADLNGDGQVTTPDLISFTKAWRKFTTTLSC